MSHKRVAIVQSSYIPWKGYFDLIRAVDEFILLDDVQFTKRDWRSRNRIKTKDGVAWLSIPVHTKGRYLQRIEEATICRPGLGRAPLADDSRRLRAGAVLRRLRAAVRAALRAAGVRSAERRQSRVHRRDLPGARHHDADYAGPRTTVRATAATSG